MNLAEREMAEKTSRWRHNRARFLAERIASTARLGRAFQFQAAGQILATVAVIVAQYVFAGLSDDSISSTVGTSGS